MQDKCNPRVSQGRSNWITCSADAFNFNQSPRWPGRRGVGIWKRSDDNDDDDSDDDDCDDNDDDDDHDHDISDDCGGKKGLHCRQTAGY